MGKYCYFPEQEMVLKKKKKWIKYKVGENKKSSSEYNQVNKAQVHN